MADQNVLEVQGLHKSFGVKKVIRDVSFSVCRGEALGFIGPNRAGKATTIRLILGLLYADKGTIKIGGYNIKSNFYRAIARVGAMVETPKFYPFLSGHILHHQRPYHAKKKPALLGIHKKDGQTVRFFNPKIVAHNAWQKDYRYECIVQFKTRRTDHVDKS